MVKAIAERERFPTPGFFRYAAFAFVLMLPAHLVTTVALAYLDAGAAHAPKRSAPWLRARAVTSVPSSECRHG
jgi:hypothetical protein